MERLSSFISMLACSPQLSLLSNRVTVKLPEWLYAYEASLKDVEYETDEAMMDVAPTDFICVLSQTWAERECECSGPPIPPLGGEVVDPNPSCSLCPDNGVVPLVLREELVQTGIAGRMPCGGLSDALAEGILPASYCSGKV